MLLWGKNCVPSLTLKSHPPFQKKKNNKITKVVFDRLKKNHFPLLFLVSAKAEKCMCFAAV